MRIDLIGFGIDSPRTLTLAARRALRQAQLVLGAPRLLTLAKHLCSGPFLDAITPGEIQKILHFSIRLNQWAHFIQRNSQTRQPWKSDGFLWKMPAEAIAGLFNHPHQNKLLN